MIGALGRGRLATSVAALYAGMAVTYLPDVGSAALATVGVAKVVPTWTGPVYRLVRPSDSATMDVMPLANGRADVASVEAWLATGSNTYAYYNRLYDQEGNGNHFDQAVTLNQPVWRKANAIRGHVPVTFGYNPTTGAINKRFLQAPDTLVSARQNAAMMAVIVPGAAINANAIMALGNASGACLDIEYTATLFYRLTSFGSAFRHSDHRIRYAQPTVVGVVSNASNCNLMVEDKKTALGAQSAVAMAGAKIGASDASAGYQGVHDGLCWTFHPALSDANYGLLRAAASQIFTADVAYTSQLIAPGNSLVASGNAKGYNRGPIRQTEGALSEYIKTTCLAVAGQTLATEFTNRANAFALYSPALEHNLLLLPEPTNDFKGGGTASAAIGSAASGSRSGLLGYIEDALAAGFLPGEMLAPNTMKRNDSWTTDMEAQRVAYNSAWADIVTTYGLRPLDYAGIVALQTPPTPSNLWGDNTHPSEEGEALRAVLLAAAINSCLGA